jgi:hypothetical protein
MGVAFAAPAGSSMFASSKVGPAPKNCFGKFVIACGQSKAFASLAAVPIARQQSPFDNLGMPIT